MSDLGDMTETSGGTAPPSPALVRVLALAAALLDTPAAVLAIQRDGTAVAAASIGLDVTPPLRWRYPLSAPAPLAVGDLSAVSAPPIGWKPSPRFYAGVPVPGEGGRALGVLCVIAPDPRPDPSPAAMDHLAALAALAGDALASQAARERAEATAAATAGLLADISHEMRTPLNGIVGFTQMLKRDGSLDGEALRAVDRIAEAGRGLLSIVGDALDLARVESGLVRLDLRPFSPARLVEDAAAMVRSEAEDKGLHFVLDLPAHAPGPLVGDPDRLRQVVLNLMSNAVKFTDSGTVRVSLALSRATGAGVPLTVTVEDSGVGIAVDRIPRLFHRFAQADAGVTRRFGGTGLGLAISKSIVEAMGGRIAVASAPGAGARFTLSVTLPRAVDHRPLKPPHGPPSADRGGLRGLSLLVAEDAVLNQKLVLQMLEPLGAAVDVVEDGAEAVAAMARRDYALVLMDMEMPVLDGLAATRQIRGLAGPAARVPIVALTANVFPEQLDLCREAGMDDHLTKPFGAEELAAKVLRWARRLAPAEGEG